jgi:hypothetical protein
MLEDYVKGVDSYDSIKKLTFDIADSGGYQRKIVKLKNGNYRERTVYSKKFDSTLVALWMLYYKKFFISHLSGRKNLSEYYIDIIDKTFFVVMGCLNKEKATSDNAINKYVSLSLISRLRDFSKWYSSKFYTGAYRKGEKYVFIQKYAVLNQSVPVDDINEYNFCTFDDCQIDSIVADLSNVVSNNPFGERVLNFLLISDGKVKLKNVDVSLSMSPDECTEENKKLILDAFNRIKKYLLEYTNSDRMFFRASLPSVTYSFEVKK